MAGPQIDLLQFCLFLEVDAAGAHELNSSFNSVCQLFVTLAFGRGRNELLRPGVDPRNVGIPAFGEGAKQVERLGRLLVGGDESFGVGDSRFGEGSVVVDNVPAERGEFDTIDDLGIGAARFGELASDPADLDDRKPARVRQHGCDLQDHLEPFSNRCCGLIVKAFCTVAGLQEERSSCDYFAECLCE